MRNTLKAILALSVFLFILIFHNVATASTIQNEYLLVTVDDETGRLFLSTIQGKPDIKGDEKKDLLFYDKPPSSYTLIYLDDDILTYGNDIGKFNPPIVGTRSIKLEWKYQYITAIQEVSFIKRENTGIEDGVLVKYIVKNNDKHSHKIGFRILFDTFLGENSKYHFELSNGEKLQAPKSFEKNNMPNYWISQDRKGIVCLRGVLKGNHVVTPDKVIFANYKALTENPRNFYIRRSRNFDYPPYSRRDSAVALYYKPIEIKSNGERIVYTILGLCGNESYESEKPVVEVATPKKEKKVEQITYHVRNYSAFRQEVQNISELQKEISSIDNLLSEINKFLKKRDAGEEVNLKDIEKIEKCLKAY